MLETSFKSNNNLQTMLLLNKFEEICILLWIDVCSYIPDHCLTC